MADKQLLVTMRGDAVPAGLGAHVHLTHQRMQYAFISRPWYAVLERYVQPPRTDLDRVKVAARLFVERVYNFGRESAEPMRRTLRAISRAKICRRCQANIRVVKRSSVHSLRLDSVRVVIYT